MNPKYKINIPEPCNEDWNTMKPTAIGKFCNSCAKTVVDFTNMEPNEIQLHFQKNSNVCGRFKSSQLNTLTIEIPIQSLYNQTQYNKLFLLVLFITMGTTLFSCADKNGNKQKIEKVVLVEDSIESKTAVPGLSLPPKKIPTKPSEANRTTTTPKIKFQKPKTISCSEITAKNADSTLIEEDLIYNGGIEFYLNPEYKGGMPKFKEFVQQNFTFPKTTKALNGAVAATFVVERDGSLSSFKLKKTIEPNIGLELLSVLEQSNKWIPGSQNGKATKSLYLITLNIRTDTIKKTLFKTKLASHIESIIITQ